MSVAALENRRTVRPAAAGRAAVGRHAAPLVIGALTVFVLVLRITQLHQSLYGDEVWTLQDLAGRSLGQVISTVNTGAENSPPLFFVLAWLSAKLGDPTIWIRLPSLLAGTATVPLLYLLGRDTFGRRPGVIAAAIYACAPFSVYYGIEARPYALTAFFVALSSFALIRATRRGSRRAWWLAYALAATAAAYCHYTSIFVLVAQGAWSLWVCRRRPLAPVGAAALGALLYLPWVADVRGKALAVIGVLEPLNVHNVLEDLPRPLVGYPYAPLHAIPGDAGLGIVAAVAAWGLFRARSRLREGVDPERVLIVLLALATPVGLLLYSLVFSDLWLARGLYASLPAQAVVLGALLSEAVGRRRQHAGSRQLGAGGLGRGGLGAGAPAAGGLGGVGLGGVGLGGVGLGGVGLLAVLATLLAGTLRAISPAYARPPFRQVAAYIDRTAGPRDPLIMYPSIADLAVPAQFHRHHPVRDVAPGVWRRVPVGGRAFALIDDYAEVTYHVGIPHPPGFRLISDRHHTGLVWFRLLTYERIR